MAFTRSELDHVIQLAHLDVTEAEKENYLASVSDVLAYVENLNTAPVNDLPPTSSLSHDETPMRNDIVERKFDLPLAQLAPDFDAPFFSVPRILEGTDT
ncbi:MAG: Asp-tRNA(Asn)/Glu-tRNA(Gln) amidotransferase subunit GatC [Candidatus Margulisiibacteriota bacterium]